jgi:hypothetical protein
MAGPRACRLNDGRRKAPVPDPSDHVLADAEEHCGILPAKHIWVLASAGMALGNPA